MYKIDLTVKPIWLRQDEELDDQYRAFCEFRDGDHIKTGKVCDTWGISHEVPVRNRWQERADAHHDDVGKVMSKSLRVLKERLQLTAVEAAFEMMRERKAMERERTVTQRDDDKVIRTTTRERHTPASERIVAQVLDYVMKEGDAVNNTDISALLQAMVQDTEGSSGTPTDQGVA